MEDKYYTPELEELHIGFEYEQYEDYDTLPEKKWHKQTFHLSNFNPESPYFISQNSIYTETIRVKYLDREDIESLGFVYNGKEGLCDTYIFIKKIADRLLEVKLSCFIFTTEGGYSPIIKISEDLIEDKTSYMGSCKNKSKLKSLLKDVGVL